MTLSRMIRQDPATTPAIRNIMELVPEEEPQSPLGQGVELGTEGTMVDDGARQVSKLMEEQKY